MKKIVLIAIMAIFSSGVFASSTYRVSDKSMQVETTNLKQNSFGGFTFEVTDCNGDVWEVTVSCNYDCSLFDTRVGNALRNWYINATGCDPDDFEDDLG